MIIVKLLLLLISVNAFAITGAERLLAVTSGVPAGVTNAICSGTETTSGDYKICDYTSTGASTWTIVSHGSGATYELLVVGGGGPGGGGAAVPNAGGGGGGGGAVCEQSARTASVGTYNLSVGDGKVMGLGLNGEDSTFDTVTAKGGGWAATSNNGLGNGCPAPSGGSGGGGAPNANTSDCATAGATNQTTPSGGATCYGFAGGATDFGSTYLPGAGGGGAGGAGQDGGTGVSKQGGNGGPGRSNSITGTAIEYGCGGGSGGGGGNTLLIGVGGCSNAGDGADNSVSNTAGAANTGGGGGGRSVNGNGSTNGGGSGRVVVKWKFQ